MGKVKLFVSRAQAISLSLVQERLVSTNHQVGGNAVPKPYQSRTNSVALFIYIIYIIDC